jgi:uncharacterized iron-regulated membrane protein
MNRRALFDWHSWLGLTAGLLLFVVCWSGTAAVFSREMDWAADARIRAAAVDDAAIPWQAIHANVAEAVPGWSISQINAPSAAGFAVEAWVTDPEEVMGRVYADPATGEVVGVTPYFNIQRFFRSLHMSLFIDGWKIGGIPFGYLVVGLLALILLVQLTTGLIFYRRFWRGLFKLETRKGAKVFWSDMHKLTGVWSLWFLLLIGVTGVWYLVEWKVPSRPPEPEPPAVMAAGTPTLPIGALLSRARAAYPELTVREVAVYDLDKGAASFHGQDGSLLVRDRAARIWLDSRTGAVLGVRKPSQMAPLHRWIDTADPLHFGNFGGLLTKIIWLVLGLALSAMCLTGAYLQARRQARRPSARSTILISYGVTLAILASAAGFAVKEVLGYGSGAMPTAPAGVWLVVALWCASTVGALTWWMRSVWPAPYAAPAQEAAPAPSTA